MRVDQAKSVGVRVADLRKRLAMSRTEFAGHLNVAVSTVSRWENDRSEPMWGHLQKMVTLARERNIAPELFGTTTAGDTTKCYRLRSHNYRGVLFQVLRSIFEMGGSVEWLLAQTSSTGGEIWIEVKLREAQARDLRTAFDALNLKVAETQHASRRRPIRAT